jgi:hypothetical protein
MILNKMETFADKVKSFKGIKKELKAFFSINGYSEVLGTNSLLKKVFWIIVFIALFASCMYVVDRNVRGFQANEVVTQFKVLDDQNMTFPALTFCVIELILHPLNITSKNFTQKLYGCSFESHPCNESSHFRPIQLTFFSQKVDCFSFNSGKNNLLSGTQIGITSGLQIRFNLTRTEKIAFKVHDNNERLTFSEVNNIVEQNDGKDFFVEMKKTIETKEQMPYSNCTQSINSETSHLVRKILQQNITYRQKDCFEECFEDFIGRHYSSQKLTNREVIQLKNRFDYKGKCLNLCPLECTSTTFDIIKNEMSLNPNDPKLLMLNFYYSDRKYTDIT